MPPGSHADFEIYVSGITHPQKSPTLVDDDGTIIAAVFICGLLVLGWLFTKKPH